MTQELKLISDKLTFKISGLAWRKLFIYNSISEKREMPTKKKNTSVIPFLCYKTIVSFSKCLMDQGLWKRL